MLPLMKKYITQLDQTIRCLSMDSGIMAVSPCRRSQNPNTNNVTADPQIKPMMIELSHLYFSPAHWIARRNCIAAPAKRANPGRSKDFRMAGRLVLIALFGLRSGMGTRNRARATSPPGGTLI
jgi:hypothetical protein